MRNHYLIAMVLFILIGCKGNKIPLFSSNSLDPIPQGMSYIPDGTFVTGNINDSIDNSRSQKRVSIPGFWIKSKEVTNSEYKLFVTWVRDSIARTMLSNTFEEYMITENRQGTPIKPRLNWTPKIKWTDHEQMEILEDLYLPEDERIYGVREIDTRKLVYSMEVIDLKVAAIDATINSKTGRMEGSYVNKDGEEIIINGRSSIIKKESVHIYPDTLCWIRDFPTSKSEPWATHYFSHPGFKDHPVVGVSWDQARAFCVWKTKMQSNQQFRGNANVKMFNYRLPTEAEWEYAARGGNEHAIYPWDCDSTTDEDGCILANYKPRKGDYISDGESITTRVGSYGPNAYDLYDMAGNVSEWTSSAFDNSGFALHSEMNNQQTINVKKGRPTQASKKKVIRGGSWKDSQYFLKVNSRSYEYGNKSRSYIGFRYVKYSLQKH